jgi:hypothetical protein
MNPHEILSSMTGYHAAHHPQDSMPVRFDFWRWRLERRFAIDYLLSIAADDEPAEAQLIKEAANAIEDESVTASQMAGLIGFLGERGAPPIRTTTELLVGVASVASLATRLPAEHWHLPVLSPAWASIPLHRPVFHGDVNGIRVQARLPVSKQSIPDYRLIWISDDGVEDELDIRHHMVGQLLPFAPAVWDWLFARRCTLLCINQVKDWPDEQESPLVLNEIWNGNVRSL